METNYLDENEQDDDVISDEDIAKIQNTSHWSRSMTADELMAHNAVILGQINGKKE